MNNLENQVRAQNFAQNFLFYSNNFQFFFTGHRFFLRSNLSSLLRKIGPLTAVDVDSCQLCIVYLQLCNHISSGYTDHRVL